jgi:hypothetical protein
VRIVPVAGEYDDPTTVEELLTLAKHLAADPELSDIFRRAGLHKRFEMRERVGWLTPSRLAFAPHLESRPCYAYNVTVAEALARRIFAGLITDETEARSFIEDRIRHYDNEFKARNLLLKSEIKDVMRNLLESEFFRRFEDYKRRKDEVIQSDIDVYKGISSFVTEQLMLYGLGRRGLKQIEDILGVFLNRYWFDALPDLSPSTVDRMLASPEKLVLLSPDDFPRNG